VSVNNNDGLVSQLSPHTLVVVILLPNYEECFRGKLFNPMGASSDFFLNIHTEHLKTECKLVHKTQIKYYETNNKIINALALKNHSLYISQP
jgi:hypothetical protein